MRTVLTSFVVAVLLFPACKKMPGTSSVNVEQLADTYAELLVLSERYSLAKDTLAGNLYTAEYERILRSHNLTKEEYASQFETAAGSATLYRELCDRALTKLQTMRGKPDTARTRSPFLRAF